MLEGAGAIAPLTDSLRPRRIYLRDRVLQPHHRARPRRLAYICNKIIVIDTIVILINTITITTITTTTNILPALNTSLRSIWSKAVMFILRPIWAIPLV